MAAAAVDNRAYINPALLTWARQRAGLTPEQAARRVGVAAGKLAAWERGAARPTLRQAETLARKFYVPFGYLYLSQIPQLDLDLPDLRTVAGRPVSNPSPEFEEVLNNTLAKQEWFKEYRQGEGAEPLPFIGRFSQSDSLKEAAYELADTMEISQKIRPAADKWETFLQRLIDRAEEIGVLVLRSGIVGNNPHRPLQVAEFRGFAISDPLAPLIFLNSSDARAAQTFTLMHELAHLWLGESGVSNLDYRRDGAKHPNPVERFCYRVAAAVLRPERDFLSACQSDLPEGGAAPGQGGGETHRQLMARHSPTFTRALVESALQGRTTEREAARLLNLNIPAFDKLVLWLTAETAG